MATRIILRFSLNTDTNSTVRNHIGNTILTPAGFANKGTGTWEVAATPVAPAAVVAAANAVSTLANPTGVSGANPNVTTDHVWLYID